MASARNKRRHRRSRGRLGPLFKLLCLFAIIVALTMGATVFFRVETVAVSGNSRYTQEEIIQASGIQSGDNLYRLNKIQISQQMLQALPYLESVTIRRSLPSTIVIMVTEWQAVARVEVPDSAQIQSMLQQEGEEGEEDPGQAEGQPLEVADEAWLISVGGKLLEQAGADSGGISVTGIVPIMPRAGTMLSLPQAQQGQLEALLALLAQLQQLGMLSQVTAINLNDTQVTMDYLNRFQVKMLLNADFGYKLNVLLQAVDEVEAVLGEGVSGGTFDMTQEGKAAIYTPG